MATRTVDGQLAVDVICQSGKRARSEPPIVSAREIQTLVISFQVQDYFINDYSSKSVKNV